MNTKHLLRKLPSCLLGAIFAAGIASTTMVNAVDGSQVGLFELEGNVTDEPSAVGTYTVGEDWATLYLNGGSAGTTTIDEDPNSPTFGTAIVSDPAPLTIFTQGGSKDVNDVSAWKHTNGSVPDKDDISHAFAGTYNVLADTGPHKAGDLVIYFGLDRYANNGDAHAGFWFFQNEVHAAANGTFVDSNGDPAEHVALRPDPDNPGQLLPGDVFIVVGYPQGANAHPLIKIYEWDPLDLDGDCNDEDLLTFCTPNPSKPPRSPLSLLQADEDAQCDQTGNKLFCAITNTSDLASPPWPYTPKSGSGLPHESFYEGGINITQVLGSTPCFASFLAETRSSESPTAQLKDFVLAAFPVCGIEVTKACVAGNVKSDGSGVDVPFFGTLENDGASSYIAYLKDDPEGSTTGSTIDRVCVDTLIPGCSDDPDVTGLVLQADGSAYFPLAAGAIVRYEGSYSVEGLPPLPTTGFPLNDEVTALAFSDEDDVPANLALPLADDDPVQAQVIIADSAEAGCPYTVDPKLEVVKDCELFFLEGDHVEVTISGTVENTGNVPLSNVTVDDNKFGAITFPTTLAVGSGPVNYSKTMSVSYASLGKSFDGPDANGVVTVNLTHTDEVTANGEVLSNGTPPTKLGEATHKDTASCPGSFTTGIDVQKDCEVALDFDEVTGKIVVRVDVSATVTNLGSEDLTGLLLADVPALADGFKVNGAAVPTSLAAGGSFVATGSYFPSTTDGGDNETPGLASFTDTADVSASGAFSSLSATDENTAVCDLCPPLE